MLTYCLRLMIFDENSGIDPALLEVNAGGFSGQTPASMPDGVNENMGSIDAYLPEGTGQSEASDRQPTEAGDGSSNVGLATEEAQSSLQEEPLMEQQERARARKLPQSFPTDLQQRKSRAPRDDTIALYLEAEGRKCDSFGLRSPADTYYTEHIESELMKCADLRNVKISQRILLCIGSTDSLVLLRDAIQGWRSGAMSWPVLPLQSLRGAELFKIIESNAQDIAYRLIQQRYYTLALFEKCGGADTPFTTGFVSMENNGDPGSRRSGNPLHNIEADLSKRLLNEIAPGLDPGSPAYIHKLNVIKSYRTRGRRYRKLAVTFGPGILALIPSTDQLTQDTMGVTESE